MRHIGNLGSQELALRLQDYLLAQGIHAKVEAEQEDWALWVHDEDHVQQARREFAEFQHEPDAPRFREAAETARRKRIEQQQAEAQAKKNTVDVRRQWQRPMWQRAQLTSSMIVFSVAVAMLASVQENDMVLRSNLAIAAFDETGRQVAQEPLKEVRDGQVWRLITPIFVHAPLMESGFGFLHLLFNMLWLRDLGSVIELRRGTAKLAGMVVVIAVLSNFAQYVDTGPYFCGMSGVVFGLFGYIWMQSRLDPDSGFYVPPNLVLMMMVWFILCFTGAFGAIANTAHGVGLAVGALLGATPPLLRRLARS